MRRLRVRLSVRRMMVLIAMMALAAEVELWRRRSPYCQSNADRCSLAEKAHLRTAESHERIARLYRRHAADPRQSARYNNEQAALFARFADLEKTEAKRAASRREAFRNAARYPWVSIPAVEPDPLGAGIIEQEEKLKEAELKENSKGLAIIPGKVR
jgi:hypothetical protein